LQLQITAAVIQLELVIARNRRNRHAKLLTFSQQYNKYNKELDTASHSPVEPNAITSSDVQPRKASGLEGRVFAANPKTRIQTGVPPYANTASSPAIALDPLIGAAPIVTSIASIRRSL
jgi:hypothetical protein